MLNLTRPVTSAQGRVVRVVGVVTTSVVAVCAVFASIVPGSIASGTHIDTGGRYAQTIPGPLGAAAGDDLLVPVAAGSISTRRSGLAWASGVYVPGSAPSGFRAFEEWRGRRLDVAVMWSARQTWDDIVDPSWIYDRWSGIAITKVIGVAPIPEGVPSATMQGCANGDYNSYWKRFAQNIKARGMDDDTVIRLGWEMNGDWYKWSANDPRTFVACWRQIVGTAERVAPALRWDWTVNRGVGKSVKDARVAYPGNAYVDIVGVDSYDMWPAVRTAGDWRAHLDGPYGLKFWADFAASHGKRLSVPEWGVYPGSAQPGNLAGDNAVYVARMQEFFRTHARVLAYEAYFNESADYYAGSLYGPTQVPRAAAQYRHFFRR